MALKWSSAFDLSLVLNGAMKKPWGNKCMRRQVRYADNDLAVVIKV
jgi:hypothetical protein